MSTSFIETIANHFEEVTDPRADRGLNYPLVEMIFVALCGTICDCNSWVDVSKFGTAKLAWFRKFLPFERGIPSHDTFSEVFARLDSVQFYAALQSWTTSIVGSLKDQMVAFDGKTLCGSFDRASSKSALHSVSAWACGLKLCLGLKSVEDKSNEIPAVQQLIELLDLKGAIVTADAMHCQVETAAKISDKDADYVLIAKGNQESLRSEIRETLANAFEQKNPRMRQCSATETNRGREETRDVVVMPVPKNSKVFSRWPEIKTIGAIYRSRKVGEQAEEFQDCFISSLPCSKAPRYSAIALEYRELTALYFGCNIYRRFQPNSQRNRARSDFCFSQTCAHHSSTGHFHQREYSWKTKNLRLG